MNERSESARELAQEVTEDLRFQLWSWRLQRAGWLVAVLVLGAALAGLFGGGFLSQARARSSDGRLEVEYEVLARHGRPAAIDLRVDRTVAVDGKIVIWLSEPFVDGLEVRAIVPEPSRALDGDGRTGYEFELDPAGTEPLDVSLDIEYVASFLRDADITAGDSSTLHITQFVYP